MNTVFGWLFVPKIDLIATWEVEENLLLRTFPQILKRDPEIKDARAVGS